MSEWTFRSRSLQRWRSEILMSGAKCTIQRKIYKFLFSCCVMNDRLYLEIEREGEVAALIFLYILIVYYIGGRQTGTPSIIQYTWEKSHGSNSNSITYSLSFYSQTETIVQKHIRIYIKAFPNMKIIKAFLVFGERAWNCIGKYYEPESNSQHHCSIYVRCANC